MQSVIEAENVRFKYESAWVLDGINFKVEAGDYVGLIGPNGGGKTTLLKVLLGLEKGQGKIRLFGTRLSGAKKPGSAEPFSHFRRRSSFYGVGI